MEEMRKQFEQWFCKEIVEQPVIFPKFADGEYTEGYDYDFEFYQMLQAMWMTWKASRAALVVELPKDVTNVTNKLYEEGRDDVIAAVESAGITVKGEGDGQTNVFPPK